VSSARVVEVRLTAKQRAELRRAQIVQQERQRSARGRTFDTSITESVAARRAERARRAARLTASRTSFEGELHDLLFTPETVEAAAPPPAASAQAPIGSCANAGIQREIHQILAALGSEPQPSEQVAALVEEIRTGRSGDPAVALGALRTAVERLLRERRLEADVARWRGAVEAVSVNPVTASLDPLVQEIASKIAALSPPREPTPAERSALDAAVRELERRALALVENTYVLAKIADAWRQVDATVVLASDAQRLVVTTGVKSARLVVDVVAGEARTEVCRLQERDERGAAPATTVTPAELQRLCAQAAEVERGLAADGVLAETTSTENAPSERLRILRIAKQQPGAAPTVEIAMTVGGDQR
jgi:hypothetical protein